MIRRATPRLYLLLTLAWLVGCGGGGSGGGESATPTVSDPPPTTPPPSPTPPSTVGVAGRLSVLSEAIIDSDTNNPDNPSLPNDTIETAQASPNPATIGGYLAGPGTGSAGALGDEGDIEDYYRINAVAGQRITMLIADTDAGDVDLYLYNEGGFIEAFSVGVDDREQVTVPTDGVWYVNPSLFSGASNYTVTLGGSGSGTQQIRPGELIIELAGEQVLRPAAARERAKALVRDVSGQWRGGDRGRDRLLALARGQQALDPTRRLSAKADALQRRPELLAQWQTWQLAKQLARRPEVKRVEPNRLRSALRVTNDQYASLQWDHSLINLPAAWEFTAGDPSIVVAVIDSGVLPDHPDLAGQLVPGFDFVADSVASGDGDGIDADPTDEGATAGADIGDYSYHGTHVTGIVGAAGDNAIGIAGVAFGSRVMPLRAISGDTGSSYDVLQAVRYAAGLANDSGQLPARRANIINLSLGGSSGSQSEQNLLDSVIASGTVVVAAAGNDGASTLSFPAAYPNVIAVGATDLEGNLTGYSNTGQGIDLVAPGGDGGSDRNGDGYPDAILSTGRANDDPAYTFLAGTSMAAPTVSGVIALMQSVNPALTPDDISALLERGALTETRSGIDYDQRVGWGLIDAQKSLLAALESIGATPSQPARLTVSTGFANFGVALSAIEVRLDNRGTEALTVTEVASDVGWLSAVPGEVDEAGLGSWRLRADRSDLAEGEYRGRVRFASSVNTVSVEVGLRVASSGTGDVGTLYVLFYDPVAEEAVFQVTTNSDGSYRFDGEVPAGRYEVWAGTDNDNDQFICDAGESCGAFRTLDAPITVDFDRNRDDLDFPSGYQLRLRAPATVSGTATAPRSLRRLR